MLEELQCTLIIELDLHNLDQGSQTFFQMVPLQQHYSKTTIKTQNIFFLLSINNSRMSSVSFKTTIIKIKFQFMTPWPPWLLYYFTSWPREYCRGPKEATWPTLGNPDIDEETKFSSKFRTVLYKAYSTKSLKMVIDN